MNAGGTDAAPTIAGPGLKLGPAPEIAIGAPTISAEAMATTATAKATTDMSALRHALCFFGASVTLEKTPRLRGGRAARVGGNCGGGLKSKSRRVAWNCRSSRTPSLARPVTQRGRLMRTLRATRLSLILSMISSPRGFERAYCVHGSQFSAADAAAAAADSAPHMPKIHVGSRACRLPAGPIQHAGRQGVHRGTCAITIVRSGKRAVEAPIPAPTAATWRRPTNSR